MLVVDAIFYHLIDNVGSTFYRCAPNCTEVIENLPSFEQFVVVLYNSIKQEILVNVHNYFLIVVAKCVNISYNDLQLSFFR